MNEIPKRMNDKEFVLSKYPEAHYVYTGTHSAIFRNSVCDPDYALFFDSGNVSELESWRIAKECSERIEAFWEKELSQSKNILSKRPTLKNCKSCDCKVWFRVDKSKYNDKMLSVSISCPSCRIRITGKNVWWSKKEDEIIFVSTKWNDLN